MTVGLVTGLRGEAACVAAAPGIVVLCAGPGPSRAAAAARRLLDEGATILVSFGVAGALARIVQPGDLLLPEAVVLADGSRLPVAADLRRALEERLQGVRLHGGVVAASDRPVLAAAAKKALRDRTGAMAVDMESHAVGRVAAQGRVPFLVLRAAADAADTDVPDLALAGMAEDGSVRPWPVIRGLARQPRQLPALLRLGGELKQALAALRRAASALQGLE